MRRGPFAFRIGAFDSSWGFWFFYSFLLGLEPCSLKTFMHIFWRHIIRAQFRCAKYIFLLFSKAVGFTALKIEFKSSTRIYHFDRFSEE
jgi:hypothetical protein